MESIVEKRQERISKMQAKINKIKKDLAREQSALKTAARKQDTRDKIQLGGLLRIAFEVEEHRPENLDTLLGGLMYVVRAIRKNEKSEMLNNWTAAGAAERIKRDNAKKAKTTQPK